MKNLLSMKTPVLALFISLVAFGACVSNKQTQPSTDYTQLVNPFIGTDFTGNTYPGAQAPFGMVQLSPDNGLPGWDRISGYFYPDSTIAGFSHTHLSGTGAGDLYDISFMPVTLPYQEAEAPLGIYSKFSHADEEASAGYYRVLLKDYDINVELTATERCGIQRYTFPEGESAVFLNLKKAMNWDFTNDSYIEIIDSCTIQGYRFSEGWTGRLVGIQLLNLVVQLARTSGDGGFGMAVRTLEGDGTARGSFDGDLSGFGIAGGGPFEGMLVAQGDGREGGRFGKGAEKRGITSFTSASGIALAHFKQSFAVVGSIRVAAEEMGGVLAAIGLFDVFVAITGTGARATAFLRLAGGRREGTGTTAGRGTRAGRTR